MTPTTKTPPLPSSARLTKALAAVPDTPSAKGDEPSDRGRIAFRVFVAVLLLIGVGAAVQGARGSSAEDDLATLLRVVQLQCSDNDPNGELDVLCRQTEQVRNDNAAAIATAEGLNTEQVVALVQAELAAQGGDAFTRDDAVGLVRSVLTENPDLYRGEPGQPASDEQVLMAAAAVIAANPDRFRGEPGVDGQSPPCLSEPDQCRGRGVLQAEVVDCRWQITYTDGVTEDAGSACASSGDGDGPASPAPDAGAVDEEGGRTAQPAPSDPTPADPQPADPGTEPPPLFG